VRLINRYGPIEDFPPEVLAGERREQALLFKRLATLRTDAPLFADVEQLRWRGPTDGFAAWAERIGDARLLPRLNGVRSALTPFIGGSSRP
jgi:IS5 family transposase